MTPADAKVILSEMEAMGSEQTRKTYRRHGIGDNQFGVSYAYLGKLQKQYKNNHELALELWDSQIYDAQVLAYMIADPQQADSEMLDKWAYSSTNYGISDALVVYVAKSPLAKEKAEAWIQSDNEWVGQAGWNTLGRIASTDTSLPDSYFEAYLATIERDLHRAKNYTRYAMNNALIAIGTRNPALQAAAVAVAKRIGKVEVDHGQTSCKTPDAITYIQKAVDHKMQKAANQALRKAAKSPVTA